MYILTSAEMNFKKDIWAGKTTCPYCNQQSDFHLVREVKTVSAFFIPFISITEKRYIVCDSCNSSKELTKKDFNEIKKRQLELLKQGNFPESIIREDFSPKKLGLVWKIIKLILSGLIAIPTFFGIIISLIGNTPSGTLTIPLICSVYFIPFILSLKNFIPAYKMKKAYSDLIKRQ